MENKQYGYWSYDEKTYSPKTIVIGGFTFLTWVIIPAIIFLILGFILGIGL